jgi:ATP-binding cassette subfamily D (ALD) long-chain fatty acid import protein
MPLMKVRHSRTLATSTCALAISRSRADAVPATLEGELRFTHSRLLESAEEVALYHGEEFEKNVIERGYFALVKHINRVIRIRVWHGMAEEGVIKWLWGALGLGICAIPVFGGSALGMKAGEGE